MSIFVSSLVFGLVRRITWEITSDALQLQSYSDTNLVFNHGNLKLFDFLIWLVT